LLFNSPIFILAFLPVTFLVYFFLTRGGLINLSKVWLVFASLFFYGYWNPIYLLLIGASIGVNFTLANRIREAQNKQGYLYTGILFNLGLLGYFKYADFFINNVNAALSTQIPELNVVLPLAISFFTFQQVAYLVDTKNGDCKESNFLSYCLFICFFPQLIAGPIVHHKEMMPQFDEAGKSRIQSRNVMLGLMIFAIGLFKKVVLADALAQYVDPVFHLSLTQEIEFTAAWLGSLAYTFQLYFDFSGYCDMAIGAALLFNIVLPINFNSPYKAVNIQDFWRRWHMTLSRWFRDYVYVKLGGNRVGKLLTLRNVFLTAFVSGIWHGAGWTFVIWGTMHGLAMVVHRLYSDHLSFSLPRWLAWALTFLFVNFAWVVFRAESLTSAMNIYAGMFNVSGVINTQFVEFYHSASHLFSAPRGFESVLGVYWVLGASAIAFWGVNSLVLSEKMAASQAKQWLLGGALSLLFFTTLISLGNKYSAFIYFNF